MTLDDGLDFGGYPQPPTVPPDPTGEDWRGPPGPPGPPGAPGASGIADAPTDGNAYLRSNAAWSSGGQLTSGLNINAPETGPSGYGANLVLDSATHLSGVHFTTAHTGGYVTLAVDGTNHRFDIAYSDSTTWLDLIEFDYTAPLLNLMVQRGGPVQIGGGQGVLQAGPIAQWSVFNAATHASGTTNGFLQSLSISGTNTTTPSLSSVNQFNVASDTLNKSGQALFNTGIWHNFGGTAYRGNRGGLIIMLNQTGVVAGSSNAGGIEGLHIEANTTNTFGGSDPGPGSAGNVFGQNIYNKIQTGTANLLASQGMEVNVEAQTGTSYGYAGGIAIVSTGNHKQAGSQKSNYGYAINGQPGSIGLDVGFDIVNRGFAATATLLNADYSPDLPNTFPLARAFDLRTMTFSRDAIATADFAIASTGRARVGTGFLDKLANGIGLSADGAICTGGTLTASVTTAYASDGNHSWVEDPYGGIWEVTFTTGTTITGITLIVPGVTKGAPPANPVTLTPRGRLNMFGPGAITANLTWDTSRTTVAVQAAGGPTTFGGAVTLAADPTTALQAATKQYVDAHAGGGGTVTSITAGTGLSGGTITASGTLAIANTAVTPASYTNSAITVNAQGQITAASSGVAPPAVATTTPVMDGTAAIGSDTTHFAAANHVHPTDTSRAPLASPAFTGAASITAPETGYSGYGNNLTLDSAGHFGSIYWALGGAPATAFMLASDPSVPRLDFAYWDGSVWNDLIEITRTFTRFTQAITPSGGLNGLTNASNAAAGVVGEYLTANNTSGTSMTSGSTANIATLSLTAGDWDVQGSVIFTPAASTTVSVTSAGINTTSATLPTATNIQNGAGVMEQRQMTMTAGVQQVLNGGTVRINVSATTNVYLVANTTFATSTMSCTGFIGARRRR